MANRIGLILILALLTISIGIILAGTTTVNIPGFDINMFGLQCFMTGATCSGKIIASGIDRPFYEVYEKVFSCIDIPGCEMIQGLACGIASVGGIDKIPKLKKNADLCDKWTKQKQQKG